VERLRIFRCVWWITAKVGTARLLRNHLDNVSTATPVANPVRGEYCQPPIVRAPEVTLKYPWTSAIDIWTVGCLVRTSGACIAQLRLNPF
jgi:hypothetical protein